MYRKYQQTGGRTENRAGNAMVAIPATIIVLYVQKLRYSEIKVFGYFKKNTSKSWQKYSNRPFI